MRKKQDQIRAQKRWDRNWAELAKIQAGYIQDQIPPTALDTQGTYLHEVLPDQSWKGRRCFIIGGGPSLQDFDFSKLKGELVIGINRAFEVMDCTVAFSMDSRFFQWVMGNSLQSRQRFIDFQGFKVWINTNNFPYRGVYVLAAYGRDGLSQSMTEGICHGSNSGHAALNLAICLGANPIYLLGYDFYHEKGRSHYHSGYPRSQRPDTVQAFLKFFNDIKPEIRRHGTNVVNLNPKSKLRIFPFDKIENVIT